MNPPTAQNRIVEPRAIDWRGYTWAGGSFDTAHRPYTALVEGTIQTPTHLVLVTLDGGAEHLEVDSACGHRYRGDDRRGAVSFVPAHCERRLRLRGVRSRWASVALRPELLDLVGQGDSGRATEIAPFTNLDDPLLAGLVAEFARLHALDGTLDPGWCDAMSLALAHTLARRYSRPDAAPPRRPYKLPAWQLRRIAEYVDARIDTEIRIADLAAVAGVSIGYLHRAFRASTGKTPLEFIHARRIRLAMRILATEPVSIADLAARVGFTSPSYFARTFRRLAGVNPSLFRKA